MSAITLMAPVCLGAGLIVVLLSAVFYRAGYKARKAARAAYGETWLIDRFSVPLSARAEMLIFSVYALCIMLLSLAAAQPVVQGAAVRARAGTVDVVIVSDVSRSMASEEYRPFMPDRDGLPGRQVSGTYGSRLDFVKYTIESRIMPAMSGNRLGIVTYSGLGFTQAELTFDHASLRWIIRHWMPVGGAPGNGSDFASGLREALQLFFGNATAGNSSLAENQEERERVIVLFSDGGFTGSADDLLQVVSEMERRRVRLIIVGVGGTQPSAIPQYSSSGEMRGNLMRDGQPVLTHFEEDSLRQLREASGGEYIRLAPGDALEIRWANALAGERVEIGVRHLFAIPLSVALALLLLLQVRGVLRRPGLSKKENNDG